MPIRKENQWRYPANWPEISASIRDRAWNMCEECGVENHRLGGRAKDGTFLPADPTGDNGLRFTWPKPGEYGWCGKEGRPREWLRIIRIVLTVAHLNQLSGSFRGVLCIEVTQLFYNCYVTGNSRLERENIKQALTLDDVEQWIADRMEERIQRR